jgi:hypothetical protein
MSATRGVAWHGMGQNWYLTCEDGDYYSNSALPTAILAIAINGTPRPLFPFELDEYVRFPPCDWMDL